MNPRSIGLPLLAALTILSLPTGGVAKPRPPHPRQAEIDSLFGVARGRLEAGDGKGAVLPLQEILSLDPRSDRAYLGLGDAQLLMADPGEAKDAFKKALSIRTTAEAYDGIGRTLMAGNRIQTRQAIDYFHDALSKDRGYVEAQYHIAQATWKLKDLDAKSEMDRAYKMRPDDPRVHMLLAEWYQHPPTDFAKSILWYERYIQARPDDLDIAHRLGDLYVRNRQYDRARELLQLILQKQPDMVREFPIIAQSHMAQGDFDRANELFSDYLDRVDGAERAYYDDITFVGSEDEIATYAATTAREERYEFLRRFWAARDAVPATPVNERLLEHYRRVWVARNRYGEQQSPWDRRGEIYIRYGEPDYRARSDEIDYVKANDMRVQRIKERLALGLYGSGFVMNASSLHQGPVYPVRGPGRSPQIVATGVSSQVPWESWIYFGLGGGIEVTFTDEMLGGRYDYAPIPFGVPGTSIITYAPKVVMESVAAVTPDAYQPDVAGPLVFGTYPAEFRGMGGKTRLEVYTGVPLSEINGAPQDSDRVASVERTVVVFDTTWREVSRSRELMALSTTAVADTGAAAFLPDVKAVELPPGNYHLAVQVTDPSSNRMQAYRQRIRLTDYGTDSLRLSDIELAVQIAPGTGSDPFVKNGLRVLPAPSRAYRRDQNLYLYYEVYNLKRDAVGGTRYRVDYTVRSKKDRNIGAQILSGLGRLVGTEQKKGEITISYDLTGSKAWEFIHVEINVQEARAGNHLVRVAVTDLNSGSRADREANFEIGK